MWPPSTITIAFRGLLVFHEVTNQSCGSFFEVGVIRDPHHILRINTIKNCLLTSTTRLKGQVNPRHPYWRLVVDNPVGAGVSKYTRGEKFDRIRHDDERDYRWINNFNEHFENAANKVDLDCLVPILRIPHGVFYTLLKSIPLTKIKDGTSFAYGSQAEATGLDISFMAGRVRLVHEHTCKTIFNFLPEANTTYEFANTPPDIDVEHDPHDGPHPGSGEVKDDALTGPRHRLDELDPAVNQTDDPCRNDHFKNYYQLFKDPSNEPSVCFKIPGPRPAPDPYLCGAVGVTLPGDQSQDS
jgi:hypothetical protein